MALFSGGRYIRGRLRDAFAAPFPTPLPANTNINNTDSPDSQTERDERAGLSFWDFPSDTDGEDLKLLYKSRIAILSPSLTPQEHVDIVNESVEIMIRLTDIVREVADTIPAKAAALEQDLREKVERSWNVDGDGDEMRGPMRMIRLPWILLLRYWFPWGAMDAVTRAVGTAVVPARVPAGHHAMGKGAPVPVPVRAR